MNKEDLQRIKDHDLWPKVMEHLNDSIIERAEWMVSVDTRAEIIQTLLGKSFSFAIPNAVQAALSDFDDESKGETSPSEMVAEMNSDADKAGIR